MSNPHVIYPHKYDPRRSHFYARSCDKTDPNLNKVVQQITSNTF